MAYGYKLYVFFFIFDIKLSEVILLKNDKILFFTSIALAIFGLIMIYSSSYGLNINLIMLLNMS